MPPALNSCRYLPQPAKLWLGLRNLECFPIKKILGRFCSKLIAGTISRSINQIEVAMAAILKLKTDAMECRKIS